jgi:tRNA dimethylallyltransferase
MNETRHLIIVTGPTAVGKTELSIRLAQHLETEIISADSRQIYEELKIGVARPSAKELSEVTHHFIGSHSIHESFTVADYELAASEKIEELFQSKNYVVCTGGTGLYLKSLTNGLDKIPRIDSSISLELQVQFEKNGLEYLQNKLSSLDPEYFEKVDLSNSRRLIRALEVYYGTGRKFSDWRTEQSKKLPYQVHYVVLDRPREELYDRINKRVDQMMEMGLLEEVKQLFKFRNLRSLQTVGYSEFFQYLEGKVDYDFALNKVKQHTRNYAKRQLTWFRGVPEAVWKSARDIDAKHILDSIVHK